MATNTRTNPRKVQEFSRKCWQEYLRQYINMLANAVKMQIQEYFTENRRFTKQSTHKQRSVIVFLLCNYTFFQICTGRRPLKCIFHICRNASGMWTYSFQMRWNIVDICENGQKSMQIPFFVFLYVGTELRIPETFPCLFVQDVENTSRCWEPW